MAHYCVSLNEEGLCEVCSEHLFFLMLNVCGMTSQFSDHTVDSRVHVNAISVLLLVDVIYSIGMNRHTHCWCCLLHHTVYVQNDWMRWILIQTNSSSHLDLQPWNCLFLHLHLCILSKATYSAFRLYIFCQYVCSLGIEPTTFCAANTILYHWATGTQRFYSAIC